MRLRSSRGEFVPGRCRAANLCAYCARLAAVENAECLWIDAMAGAAPTLWLVLTTRSTNATPAAYYEARRHVLRALKRRWPAAEVAMLFEMTTGHGSRSGGERRPHWNLWVKGVAGFEQEAAQLAIRVWCGRADVDAVAQAQSWRNVHDMRGLTRYCAMHFQKQDQAPPTGWRGHRFSTSRGYFARPMPEVRAEARASLRAGRRLWAARNLLGEDAPAELVELEAAAMAEREAATTWELVRVGRTPGGVLVPGAVVDPRPTEGLRRVCGQLVDLKTGELVFTRRGPPP
jgi:hypothetical protein